MGIFDRLTHRHKDTEQEDPNLAQQQGGQQQDYEYSQDMGTAQGTIGQQPQGGYDDPNMSNQGYQDPNMGGQDPSMTGQGPSMSGQDPGMTGQDASMTGQDPGMSGQDPGMSSQDPSMSSQDPDEDPNMGEGQHNQGW